MSSVRLVRLNFPRNCTMTDLTAREITAKFVILRAGASIVSPARETRAGIPSFDLR